MLALVGCGASLVHRRISTQTFRGPVNCTSDQPYVSTKLDPQGWSEVHDHTFLQQGGRRTQRGEAHSRWRRTNVQFLWKTLPKAQRTQISSGSTKEIV